MTHTPSNAPSDRLNFEGLVVLVTGAGRGMGLADAELLAARGAKVIVNDLGTSTMHGGTHSTSVAAEAAEAIVATGGVALASDHDISTPEGADAAVALAVDTWGRIDAVVHNAAISSFTAVAELSPDEYDRVRAVSLDGAVHLTRAAWPHMAAQGFGRFVYISSTAGLLGVPGNAAYGASKTGMLGLMNVVRLEGQEHNITANTLGVAAYTRMTKTMFAGGDAQGHEALESWWERYMAPEKVAAVVAWLLHPDCAASGDIFDTKGGHVERLALVSSRGWTDPDITPESLRDNWDQVQDLAEHRHYRSGWESAEAHFDAIVAAGAAPLPTN